MRSIYRPCRVCLPLLLPVLAAALVPPAASQAPVLHLPAPPQQSVRLLGLTFQQPGAESGQQVRLIIRLNRPAPPGGFLLMLNSSHPKALRLPSRVTIPVKATALGLTLATRQVAANSVITVRAAEASEMTTKAPQAVVYRTAQLRLTPASKVEKGGER